MTPSDVWMSPAQLAGLPGLPGSEYRTRARLKALGIPSRVRQGRLGGGGLEYDCAALPAVTREALMLRQVQQAAPEMLPAHVPPQDLVPVAPRRPPSRDESACADARVHLVRQMRDMAHLAGGISRAAEQLSRVLGSGAAEAPLCQIAAQANQRQRQAGCANGVAISSGDVVVLAVEKKLSHKQNMRRNKDLRIRLRWRDDLAAALRARR